MRRLVVGLGRAAEGQLGSRVQSAGKLGSSSALPSVLIEATTPSPEIRLTAGDAFSAIVSDGRAFVAGRGKHGELGLGEAILASSDFCAVSLSGDKRAAAAFSGHGASHTVFLDDEGIPHVSGTGSEGQLGLGGRLGPRGSYHGGQQEAAVFEPVPAREPFSSRGERVVHAALSRHRTVFLTDAGNVYTAGTGFHGELGLGTVTYATEPTGWHEAPEQEFLPLASAHAAGGQSAGDSNAEREAANVPVSEASSERIITPGTLAAAAALGAAVDAAVAATAAARKAGAKPDASADATLALLLQQADDGDGDGDDSFDPQALAAAVDGHGAGGAAHTPVADKTPSNATAAAISESAAAVDRAVDARQPARSSLLPRFVSVACGLNFTIAASACGRLFFCGRVGKPGTHGFVGRSTAAAMDSESIGAAAGAAPSNTMHSSLRPVELQLPCRDGKVQTGNIQVAAGLQHAAITDGQRLWLLGSGFVEDPSAKTPVESANTTGSRAVGVGPHELHLERYIGFKPTSIRVACGPYSTAIIADGKLYLMGRVESEAFVSSGATGAGQALVGSGFGVFEDLVRPREEFAGRFVATLPSPTLVPHASLHGEGRAVRDAALGAGHAIVAVEHIDVSLR